MTITDGNFSVPSKPNLESTPKVSHSGNVGTKNDGIHFSNIMMDSLEYLKKMLGLTPDCLNGGMKTLRGKKQKCYHYRKQLLYREFHEKSFGDCFYDFSLLISPWLSVPE